jgi:hypothetical protein
VCGRGETLHVPARLLRVACTINDGDHRWDEKGNADHGKDGAYYVDSDTLKRGYLIERNSCRIPALDAIGAPETTRNMGRICLRDRVAAERGLRAPVEGCGLA